MLRAIALALTMVGVGIGSAQAAGLTATQIVERATMTVAVDGRESLTYSPASEVQPGERVRYSLVYANDGADAAENVDLVMPVPSEVTYLEASVEGTTGTVLFSADAGQSFAPRDDVRISDGDTTRLASAAEITHIKWQFSAPIAPAATGTVSYSAVLK
jgi:uncharacterized repeat protein (TIGR01451 family)